MDTLAKKIAIILILSLVLGQVVRIPLGSVVAVTPIDIFAFVLIALWTRRNLKIKRQKLISQPNKISLALVVFTAIGFFSLLVNSKHLIPEQFLVSFLYLVRFAFLAGIYFVVREFSEKTKWNLLSWLALAGVLIAVLGLIQYFLYPDLRNLYYAGWDEHLYRIFSTFLDPNFAGAFFVLVFILLLGLLFNREKKTDLFRLAVILGTILTLTALLLTYSRSAYLAFFISLSTLFILAKRVWLVVFLLLFILGILLLPKNLPSEGVDLGRTASVLARQESTQKALIIIKDNPLLGVGFNAYRYAQMRYGFLKDESAHSGAGTDNSFLFVLATTGIIGFMAYLYLWYQILSLAFQSRKLIVPKIVIVSSFTLFVNSLFINSLFYESIMVWMWLLIGTMERK